MPTLACDAKRFERGKRHENEANDSDYYAFQTPLGAAVWFKEDAPFLSTFTTVSQDLARSFQLETTRPFFSSEFLKEKLGIQKALAFTDQLISSVAQHIKRAHITYVIYPPSRFPVVPVMGYHSTEKEIPTQLFFENLGPMFSYLTAYSFMGRPESSEEKWTIMLDSFRSKSTAAWFDLIKRVSPKVYFRGDECNAFVCCADLIAFLTDSKLYSQKLKLTQDSISRIYQGYPFEVKTHWFDDKMLSKIKWYDDRLIDFSKYIAKPTVFVLIDPVEQYFPTSLRTKNPQSDYETLQAPKETEEEKFKDIVEKSDVFAAALKLAYQKGGCAKVYSREDPSLVKDGDVLVYVGTRAKEAAATLSHMYDVDVVSGKDLRMQMR